MGSIRRLGGIIWLRIMSLEKNKTEKQLSQQQLLGTAKDTANTTITAAGFKVGTVTPVPGAANTTNTGTTLDTVATALTDTTVVPLGTAIDYTINSPYFPPFFPPFFPPYFPPFFQIGRAHV